LHAARRWIAAAESKISAAAIVVCVHVNLKVAVVDAAGDEGGGGADDDKNNDDHNNHTELLVCMFACWPAVSFHVSAQLFETKTKPKLSHDCVLKVLQSLTLALRRE
jgi:hypothetical protein